MIKLPLQNAIKFGKELVTSYLLPGWETIDLEVQETFVGVLS